MHVNKVKLLELSKISFYCELHNLNLANKITDKEF